MKLRILLVVMIVYSAQPINSIAAENYYLSGGLGIGMPMDSDIDLLSDFANSSDMSFDTGLVGSLAVGYDFASPVRLELEYLWQKNDVDLYALDNPFGAIHGADLTTQAIMFNGYYDVDTGSPWTPLSVWGLAGEILILMAPFLVPPAVMMC